MRKFGFVLGMLLTVSAFADHHAMRQAQAHAHGSHLLQVAIEANALLLIYKGPMADFESVRSLVDTKTEAAAETLLHRLLTLNPEAECVVEHAHLSIASLASNDDGHEAHHDQHHGHDHHERHEDVGGHQDVMLEANWACRHIERLARMTVQAFDSLGSVDVVEVDAITDAGVRSQVLSKDNSVLNF